MLRLELSDREQMILEICVNKALNLAQSDDWDDAESIREDLIDEMESQDFSVEEIEDLQRRI